MIDDARPQFADDIDGADKFKELIEMARNYVARIGFFHVDVGVSASTEWRWASGGGRPSRYVGKRLAEDAGLRWPGRYGP